MGGVTRRSLLASLMALSLLCGGLGVASAANSTVHVDESASGAAEVYTKTGVDTLLADYGKKEDVQTNKDDITALQNTTTTQGNQITANTTQIANNTADIEKKIDKETAEAKLALKANATDVYSKTDADARYATRMELDAKADKTALDGKADRTYVDQKLTEAGTNVDNKLADYYNKAAVDGKITAEENARNNAITTAIEQERNDRDAAITTAINGEVANRNQAINTAITQEVTARDLAVTNAKTELQEKITKEETARKEADTAFNTRLTTAEGKIGANETAIGDLKAADTALEGEITKNREDIATLNGKVATAEGNITDLKAKDTDLEKKIQINADNIQANSNAIATTDKRTAGIARNDATSETTIEKNVTVDNKGNVKAKGNVTAEGQLTGKGVDAGAGAITTKGAVNAGSLNVTDASHLKGDVKMDQKLTVTGDTALKKTDVDGALNVTGESSLKNTNVNGTLGVTGATTLDGALTAKGEAKFEKDVTMDQKLSVKGTLNTKDVTAETIYVSKSEDTPAYKSEGSIIGEGGHLSVSNEKFDKSTNITEKSELNVNEKGTVNWATSTDNATGNVTEGRSEVTADNIKNSVKKTEGGKTFGYEENITEAGKVETVTDKDGNKNELTQTATGTENTVTSKDGNKSTTKQEAGSISSTVYDKDGNVKASSEMKEDGSISNNATGDMTNTVGGNLLTTVTGQATEEFNGGLNTTVKGTENHTVNGKQINTVTEGQENNISGGQKNNILTGDQETTVSGGSIINKAENGDISNTAKNVTNEGTESVTNKVGANEVKVSTDGVDIKAEDGKKITESVGTTSRVVENDKITDKAADSTVTTEKGKGTTFGKEGSTDTTNIYGDSIKTGTINAKDTTTDKLTAGAAAGADGGRLTVDANDGVKGSYKSGKYTSKSYILANTLKSGVDNGKEPIDADFVGSRTDHYMDGDKAKLDETVKDADGSNVTNKTSTGTVTTITDVDKTNTVTSTAGGTIFSNSEAAAPVTGASGDGNEVNTKIKGNTITTGKVTMDYAEVMKDLGVHGNATVDKDMTVKGNTTLGEAGKDTTLTVNSKATFNEKATFEQGAEVKNGLTVSSGGLNVTGESTFNDKVTMNNGLDVTGGVASDSFTVKGTDIKIDSSGINAGGTVISNVADGSISEGSKDAVNGGQLYGVKRDLEHQVDKVGANAAAMANLRPMEFDPSSKWNIAAAIGNYGSETAAAIGAFYRPNDDVMVNLSTAFGTGENMVGGGVSVRLGKGSNKLSREENNALKDQVNDLTARMDALLSVLNPNMSKDFPDVPENHWAYEAVSRLAGNDIVQGYPDGEFHGERTMTRYEMAEIIYNALSRGAEAEKELVEEFKPELQAMAASEKATAERAEG